MYAHTAFPFTEERQQLARDLDMSSRSVQIWLAQASLYTKYKFLNIECSLRFKNKRQASRQLEGGRNLLNPPTSQVTVTLIPLVYIILAFLAALPSSSRAVLEELQLEIPTRDPQPDHAARVRSIMRRVHFVTWSKKGTDEKEKEQFSSLVVEGIGSEFLSSGGCLCKTITV